MLIIFDLDDTLIDTSGVIFPYKMRQALRYLIREETPDFSKHYQELLLQKQPTSKQAVIELASVLKEDPQKALKELFAPLPEGFSVPVTPYVKEMLQMLSRKYTLAVVTGGDPLLQRDKIEKAGLDSGIFSKISISETYAKRPFYETLCQEMDTLPSQTWVIGDRVTIDLIPAYEMGCQTVHMRWGRGKQQQVPEWVNYSIGTLKELEGIFT